MLEEALAGQDERPVGGGFAESVRAFEATLGQLAEECGPVGEGARWAKALGVSWPCTAQDLKRAFRRLAFETHPDRAGGSHAAFLDAQAALQEAMASLHSAQAAGSHARRYARHAPAASSPASLRATYA
jgi:hypothetical protein